MRTGEVLVSALLGLLVNECCDVSPWLADKIVRWSVRCRYAEDPVRAEIRAEELAALLDARPGKLLKLTTALGFAGGAVAAAAPRAMVRYPVRLVHRTPTPVGGAVLGVVLVAVWVWLFESGVALPEAYTLPLATVALLLGALVAHRSRWSSWRCFGVALAAAFLPTLVMIWTDASLVRLIALCLGAVLVLVAGIFRRLQAPVVAGFLTLPVAVVALLAHLVSAGAFAAILLAGIGSAFLALGAANERRRRVARSLRELNSTLSAAPAARYRE